MIPELITVATTALSAAQAGGFDIAKALGIRPKGGAGGNDPEYVAAVAKDMQMEYDTAQSAINSINDPAAQQQIADAYNAEVAAWGNPSNPNRNVAMGASRFAAQVSAIVANAKNYQTTTVPAASANTVKEGTTTVAQANNQIADTTATNTSAASNAGKVQPQNPLLNYMPLIIAGGAIVFISIMMIKQKGK